MPGPQFRFDRPPEIAVSGAKLGPEVIAVLLDDVIEGKDGVEAHMPTE